MTWSPANRDNFSERFASQPAKLHYVRFPWPVVALLIEAALQEVRQDGESAQNPFVFPNGSI